MKAIWLTCSTCTAVSDPMPSAVPCNPKPTTLNADPAIQYRFVTTRRSVRMNPASPPGDARFAFCCSARPNVYTKAATTDSPPATTPPTAAGRHPRSFR